MYDGIDRVTEELKLVPPPAWIVVLNTLRDGKGTTELLALEGAHGSWLKWLAG